MMVGTACAPASAGAVTGGAAVGAEPTGKAPVKGATGRRHKRPRARQVHDASRLAPDGMAGGAGFGYVPQPDSRPTVQGSRAVLRDGIAYAPAAAPIEVQQAVWAGNDLLDKPYVYGGGHQSFRSRGYDCSGTVSYALNGAGLLDAPLDSSAFMSWGRSGRGSWITVYTNPGHAFTVIAGLRLDTSGPGESGPRWRPGTYSTRGFKVRHPQYL
jgi:cell wall-associated NlpC family hydrolase